jgi:hypothetical protein
MIHMSISDTYCIHITLITSSLSVGILQGKNKQRRRPTTSGDLEIVSSQLLPVYYTKMMHNLLEVSARWFAELILLTGI